MDRRMNSSFPLAHNFGAPENAINAYGSNGNQLLAHSSTNSTDSIRTQLPLPYHLPDGHPQKGGYFITPELPSQGKFQSFNRGPAAPQTRTSSISLNPTSAPYFPPSPSNYDVSFGSHYGDSTNSSFSMSMPPIGAMNGNHVEQDYYSGYAGTDLSVGLASPALSGYGGAFGQFMGAATDYQPGQYGMGQPGTAQYAQGMGAQGMGYAAPAAQPWNNQYPMQYPQQQAAFRMHNQGEGQAWIPGYGPAPPIHVDHPYMTASNANRGKPAGTRVRLNNNRFSNNSSASSAKTNNNQNKQNGGVNNRFGQGGPVLPPHVDSKMTPEATKRASSALSNVSVNSEASSLNFHSQPVSQTVSQIASEDETKSLSYTDLGSPTPAPKTRKEVGFASEIRTTLTPTQRSRRGQNLTAPATDPTHTTAEWVNKLGAPPKMNFELFSNAVKANQTQPDSDVFTTSANRTPRSVVRNIGHVPSSVTHGPPPLINNVFGAHHLTLPKQVPGSAMSPALMKLTDGGRSLPSVETALDLSNLPFVEYCRTKKPTADFGVVKLKNIPYGVNRPEVLAFLGRNARIIPEQEYEPVHIVMERVTSKTLDCYVEFINLNEAVAAVNRYENNRTTGRNGRLGQRHIEMEVSSQEALMKDLFPKAKNVQWVGPEPHIMVTDPNDQYNSGFAGFISKEEMVMLVKHVEAPQRSPFSKECPQRPYECMISTLFKYPWHMIDYITIEDREQIFDATVTLLTILKNRIDGRIEMANSGEIERETELDLNLNNMLFKRLWRAAVMCTGFTPTMKDTIAYRCQVDESLAQELGIPLFAADWKYLWTIGPKPGAPHDLILWYAAVIRETTTQTQQLSLAEKAAKADNDVGPKLFGNLEKYIGHPKDFEEFQTMTLAQIGLREWAGIEQVLRQALTPRIEGPSSV